MVDASLGAIASWVLHTISSLGYFGIFLTMAIESASIPLPSEVIMPFSGFLVSTGKLAFWFVVAAGAAGNLTGSLLMYWLGFYGQEKVVRRFVRGWGRILINDDELNIGERWFRKYGVQIVILSRVLPVVRTFISLPAGVARVNFPKFVFLTFVGCFFWSAFLTYLGVKLGENWGFLEPFFRRFDIAIVVLGIIVLGVYLYLKYKRPVLWKKES
jgi:membrane protein DedA with SNARE-associated domain